MRTGANPAKAGLPAYQPKKLGVAIIVYIPFTEGYFEHALEILNIQLKSLRAATPVPYDLLVFDNGSCAAAAAELQRLQKEGEIDWLILSRHNMGKAGAWNWIFAAMPNEMICYADSDVLFRPGWWEATLAILEAFPQAGMVAAQPNFYDVMEGQGRAHLSLAEDPQYEKAEYRPGQAIIDEYCLGIGAGEELKARFEAASLPAYRQIGHEVQAVLGASHMQFVMPRRVARQVTPLSSTRGLLRTETMGIDYKTDELGYLHLSTLKPFVFHMGNTYSETLQAEAEKMRLKAHSPKAHPTATNRRPSPIRRLLGTIASRPRGQQYLLRLYNLLFQVLYREKS